jgi:GntR family histidine utilization transcriptional repressor
VTGWEDVRAEVLRRIRGRDWPPGHIIPAETDLAAALGVARGTVNRALTELTQAGILERRRKAGTRVAEMPVRRVTFAIPVIRREVEARGQVHSLALLVQDLRPPPAAIAARAGTGPGVRLWYLETLHLADGRPHVFEERWLNPDVLPPLPDFARISANEWLVRNIAFTDGEVAFSATAADARVAQALGVSAGAALLVTDRATFDGDRAITLARLFHPPGTRMQAPLAALG